MPALSTGVLNSNITDILVYYACSQGRSNIHVTVIFLNYTLLSGQEYSIFILLLFLMYYACFQGRSTQY